VPSGLSTQNLYANSITTTNLYANGITTNYLYASNGISTNNLYANAITAQYLFLPSGLTTQNLYASGITTTSLYSSGITANYLYASGGLSVNNLYSSSITTTNLYTTSLTTNNLYANGITTTNIYANGITATNIYDSGGITVTNIYSTGSLSSSGITTNKLYANGITTTYLSTLNPIYLPSPFVDPTSNIQQGSHTTFNGSASTPSSGSAVTVYTPTSNISINSGLYAFNWSYNITSSGAVTLIGITAGVSSTQAFSLTDNANFINSNVSETIPSTQSIRFSGSFVNYLTSNSTISPNLTLTFSGGSISSVSASISAVRLV
jgi:hypothetical protein